MYRHWIGLEHLGLHPDPKLNEGWRSQSKVNGIGPFTLTGAVEVSSAILIESPAWFEIVSVNAEGKTVTVQGDLVNDSV